MATDGKPVRDCFPTGSEPQFTRVVEINLESAAVWPVSVSKLAVSAFVGAAAWLISRCPSDAVAAMKRNNVDLEALQSLV